MGACGENVEKDISTWRRIWIVVDSGACDNVISPDDVPERTVFESAGSEKGECSIADATTAYPPLAFESISTVSRS